MTLLTGGVAVVTGSTSGVGYAYRDHTNSAPYTPEEIASLLRS